jgi:hypothetical protein
MHPVSGRDPVIVQVPLYGGSADIADGALIMPGVTAGTDLGLFIRAATAGADALGTLRGLHDFSVVGDSLVAGTAWVLGDVELCDQYQPIWVEYDQTDTAAVASNSGTTLTITSLEDNIDTSWIFNTTSGVKELSFLTASASGSATQKTGMGWTAADTVIKILRLGHQLVKLNTAADKIGTDAGAGSWTVVVLENWFESTEYNLQQLDPTKHDNQTLTNARFYAKLLVRNTAGHTTE